MEWVSNLRFVHISPRRARLVADLVRGKKVGHAMALLQFTPKKGATLIRKVLQSAIANATRSHGVDEDKLYVSKITVDGGPIMKRWIPRAMGRASRVRKRTSHIHIALED